MAARLGINPPIRDRVRARLEAAISESEARSAGGVSALDAGCGRKSPLAGFRARLDRFVGTDLHVPDPPLVYLDEFIPADLCSPAPQLPADAFDVVLSNFTIEHFEDPGVALVNLYRSLRPGGHIVVTTVNRRHPFVAFYLGLPTVLQRRLQPVVKASAADAHPLVGACNDPSCLRSALRAAGFEDIVLETVGNLARSWGPHLPVFILGVLGDLLAQGTPSRRSTILAVARKPSVTAAKRRGSRRAAAA